MSNIWTSVALQLAHEDHAFPCLPTAGGSRPHMRSEQRILVDAWAGGFSGFRIGAAHRPE